MAYALQSDGPVVEAEIHPFGVETKMSCSEVFSTILERFWQNIANP